MIAVVVFTTRFLGQRQQVAAERPARVTQGADSGGGSWRWLGYVIAGTLIVSALTGYGFYWWRWHEVVTVRVTDTQSREVVSYEVYQGSIDKRAFTTTDGWTVTVSDTERMEVGRE